MTADGISLPGLDTLVRTTHLRSIGRVDVDDDRATTRTSCVAHLLGTEEGAGIVVTRGLRDEDGLTRRFTRGDNGHLVLRRCVGAALAR